MAFFGFVLAFMFFCHVRKQMRRARRESMGERDHHELDWLVDWRRHWAEWNHKWAEQAQRYGDHHAEWHRQWAKRMEDAALGVARGLATARCGNWHAVSASVKRWPSGPMACWRLSKPICPPAKTSCC